MPSVHFVYPPSPLFQRGEDRCQSNISASTATTVRACNDLGEGAAVLRNLGYAVSVKDYQTEGLTTADLLNDLDGIDVLFVSTTNATIFDDLKIVRTVKEKFPKLVVILKGAIFFNPEDGLIAQLDLTDVDYLVGGESDFIIGGLMAAHYHGGAYPDGILYKKDGRWLKTDFSKWHEDLDALPFPARDLMNNALYIRPDTQEPQATIATSRGCPSKCLFCLTPHISGRKLRLRSPESIYAEMKECFDKYNIRNFFFKSDTFTYDKAWTIRLCDLILQSDLKGKIAWVANSRVNPIDLETLQKMKQAGCWLVAFGFESGSPDTLQKARKGTTVEQNLAAAKMAKKAGLKIYGFYLIGFPWETRKHLRQTAALMKKINADFVELHLATPFYGTELYDLAKQDGLIDETVLGKDYFNAPTIGTNFLSIKDLQDFRKRTLLKYHLRPSYVLKKLFQAAFHPRVLKNYGRFGFKLLADCLKRGS